MENIKKVFTLFLVFSFLFLIPGVSFASNMGQGTNVCNPCAKNVCNLCAKNACNPCAKKMKNACNPCNPCGKR